jgi:hypothetical protein
MHCRKKTVHDMRAEFINAHFFHLYLTTSAGGAACGLCPLRAACCGGVVAALTAVATCVRRCRRHLREGVRAWRPRQDESEHRLSPGVCRALVAVLTVVPIR